MHPGKKRRDYNDIESILNYRKDIIFKEHASKLDIFQDSIELLFYLTKVLNAGFLAEFKRTGKRLEGPRTIIPVLFERNNHNLLAAYKLACIGLNNPAYLNLRTVFEGITQMYLLHFTDREAYIFYRQQLGTLTEDEEKELKNKHHWLRPSRIRELLYTGEKKEQVDDFYILISNAAHPGIKRAMGDFDYRKEVTVDVLSISLALAAASLITVRDIYSSMISEEEAEEIDDLLDRVMQELEGEVLDISPNRVGLKKE
ncbi:hypothetical protein MettiDRAFT_2688 [Methanolobus tindarius DSM 2278]|uniref:Uncharacterized protein n=1 Tax=Methanolobus tindarius DSM 2278 TaxID=1090322 RepID=W9DR63_METTI|nr:hypothetical protein [Methanolobus tindarius]ETA69194.1 hypothetical protein MettiDRAFT_2688 [Methanolobus tindarius DSM 2278]